MSDELVRVVERARRGDAAAWDVLVTRFGGLIVAISRSFRLHADDAADIAQTTWLRLLESIDRIREPERIAGWIATTARRECLRRVRTVGREQPTDELDGGEATPTFPSPGQELIREQERAVLWEVVQELPDHHRQLMTVLMASPQPSYAEVADALDMPIGSIGPTRMRAVERLRRDQKIAALAG